MNRRCSWRRCLGLLAAVLPLILISCGPRVTISAPTPVVLGSSATVGTSAPDATIDSALTALTVPTERPSTTAPPTLTNTPVSPTDTSVSTNTPVPPIGSTAQSTSTIVQLQTTAEIAATEPTPIPTEIQVSNSGGGTNNIAVGGPTLRLQTRPGQTAEVKFAGRSGQHVSLGIHQTEPDWLRVTLVGPNRKNVMEGDVVGDRTLTAVLPADGTYTFLFSADAGLVSLHPTRPLDLTLTLSEYVRASIAIDDPSVSLTTRAGQLAAVSFTGKVDQHVSLGIQQKVPDWLRVTLVGPDGKNVMEADVVGDRALTAVLPAEGTYTFLFSADAGLASLHAARPLDLTLTLSSSP